MRRAFFPLLAALAGAACGSSQPSAPVVSDDAGVADSGAKPCLDEWTVSWPASGVAVTGLEFHALAAGKVLFGAFDSSDLLSVDGVSSVGERLVDACGQDARPSRRVADEYYVDENGTLRAAFVADPRDVSWNGIALPVSRREGAVVEFRTDGSLIGSRPVAYDDRSTLVYPWGGRLDVTTDSSTGGVTPRYRMVEPDGSLRWERTGNSIELSRVPGPGATAFGPDFALAMFYAPTAENTPTNPGTRFRMDAVSRDGRLLWEYVVERWGTGSELSVGTGGDISLLRWTDNGTGRELIRLDASGTERWRRTIADRNFAESGEFRISTSPDGRTLVAATAVRGATLCGSPVAGPGGRDATADNSASEGVVIGVNPDGSCAFVRVYDGALHLSSVIGARFIDDDDVRILWDDGLTPAAAPNPRSTQNLERIRWSTLVARYGVASP